MTTTADDSRLDSSRGQGGLPGAGDLIGGRYRLDHVLGRGGTGIVWRGYDEHRHRAVAVKISTPPAHLGPEEAEILRSRVLREARAAARLVDPAVVEVLDVVDSGDGIALVLELVDATSLAETVAADGPLHPAVVARIGLDVLSALVCAHESGILHRDVKPGNVLLQTDGRVRLADFGIASIEGDPALTATGLLLGSPAYISPERARTGIATTDADLWSLAATLYTAVEGVPAFDGGDALATLVAITSGRRRPCALAAELEPVLAAVLDAPASERPDAAKLRALLEPIAIEPLTPATPSGEATVDPTPSGEATVDPTPSGEATVDPPDAVVAEADTGVLPVLAADEPADQPDPTPSEDRADAAASESETVAGASGGAEADDVPLLPSPQDASGPAGTGASTAPEPLTGVDLGRIGHALSTVEDAVAERRRALADVPTEMALPILGEAEPTSPGPDALAIRAYTGPTYTTPEHPGPDEPEDAAASAPSGTPEAVDDTAPETAADTGARAVSAPRHSAAGRPSPSVLRRRRLGAGIAVVAVVAALVGVGVERSLSTSPDRTTTAAAAPTLPAGWTALTDPDSGWTGGLPPGWTVDRAAAGRTVLHSPDAKQTITVQVAPGATGSVVAGFQAADTAAMKDRKGYTLVRLGPADDGSGQTAADWEFTDGLGSGVRHVLEHGVVAGSRGFAVTAETPAASWDGFSPTVQNFLAVFAPPA